MSPRTPIEPTDLVIINRHAQALIAYCETQSRVLESVPERRLTIEQAVEHLGVSRPRLLALADACGIHIDRKPGVALPTLSIRQLRELSVQMDREMASAPAPINRGNTSHRPSPPKS